MSLNDGRQEMNQLATALAQVRDLFQRLIERNARLGPHPDQEVPRGEQHFRVLRERIAQLERENGELREMAKIGPGESGKAKSDLLTNLYIAGFQLHRCLDREAVVTSIKEILINLIGAECFQIYLLDETGQHLAQIADERQERPSKRRIPMGDGIVGVVAKTGIPYFDSENSQGDFHNPLACVAIKVDGRVVGAIQVTRLFVQKTGLGQQDHEIFSLLAEQAGTALIASTLYQSHCGSAGKDRGWNDILVPYLTEDSGASKTADINLTERGSETGRREP